MLNRQNELAYGPDGWPTEPNHHANGGIDGLSPEYEARRFPNDLTPSIIPLTIVCGPPGSGKSTYIREHAGSNDIVIDLDAIIGSMFGLPEHSDVPIECVHKALEVRNGLLRSLATDAIHSAAWFVVSAPKPSERAQWARQLGGRLEVLATPLAECARRIRDDPSRVGHEQRMTTAAFKWWLHNPHLTARPIMLEPRERQ